MRVLLIEDNKATARSIDLRLKYEGFNVYWTDLGEEGLNLGKFYDYDIILLDLNLPDIPGFEVLRGLRLAKIETPVMIVSGNTDVDNKIRGLSLGADDYMTKPFHADEMIARIHAIVRRWKGHSDPIVETGNIILNLNERRVTVNKNPLQLTEKEYKVLELLSLRKNTILTKEMFLNHLYGGMDELELKIVDVFVARLRKKIAMENGGQHHIHTVWGRGYVLRDSEAPTSNQYECPPLKKSPPANSAVLG